MKPAYSDFYKDEEDDPTISIRVDYFDNGDDPKAWILVNDQFSVPLNPLQLCMVRLLAKDASRDVDEWLMEERGTVSG